MAAANDTLNREVHALYARHHGWLHAWLRRRLGCAHQAADVAHDTYLRVLCSGQAPQDDHARPHLIHIARGLVVDRHRRQLVEQAYLDALARQPASLAPSPEEQAIALQTLLRVDAMLASLEPAVRQTFLLSQFAGLTYGEIAQRLSISPSTVRKHMALALQRCLRVLDDAALLPVGAACPAAGPACA